LNQISGEALFYGEPEFT